MLSLPGLIDPHVHLREPGAIYKEDFNSGTAAALAGGFTAVLAMPNTQPPLIDQDSLSLAKDAARRNARCDYGIFLGAGSENASFAHDKADQVCGLKMYLDQTYGPLRLDSLAVMHKHVSQWPMKKPIAAHAEGSSLAAILLLANLYSKPIHICHVSRKEEILLIRNAKEKGYQITCEVNPHHLFLSEEDCPQIGPGRCEVRPHLASKEDQNALWENLEVIDCFATDHAPHTPMEKDQPFIDAPFGVTGLETAFSVLYTELVKKDVIPLEMLIHKLTAAPASLLMTQERGTLRPGALADVCIIDLEHSWEVSSAGFYSHSHNSPYLGRTLDGIVVCTLSEGTIAFCRDESLLG